MIRLWYKVEDFIINIKRIIYWIPILWKDRFWDYSFFLKIMQAKLKYNAIRYRKYGTLCNNERCAKQMELCALLIERIDKCDYCLYPYESPSFEFPNSIKYEDYMIDQDIKLICTILRKHMRGWWD